MKRFTVLSLIAMLMLVFAGSAVAASGQMIPKIASFDFLVDYSGSMMMKYQPLKKDKIELAKIIMNRVNDKIPALNYAGGLHTFAPVSEVVPIAPYNRENLGKGINSLKNNFEVFNRLTPMGDGLANLSPTYNSMTRKAAVIIVSDGESNKGMDPVAEVQAIYAAQPGLCFHIISLADSAQGQATLDKIAALNKCSVSVKGADLLTNDAAVDQFVRDVFYSYGEEPGRIVLRSVQFAFDSSAIDGSSAAILDEVASILKQNPGQIQIDGHTCSIGTEQYNQGLSERRAAAVKKYLSNKGVPAANMNTSGYGETKPKYDNSTEEGRRLNRRAELYYK